MGRNIICPVGAIPHSLANSSTGLRLLQTKTYHFCLEPSLIVWQWNFIILSWTLEYNNLFSNNHHVFQIIPRLKQKTRAYSYRMSLKAFIQKIYIGSRGFIFAGLQYCQTLSRSLSLLFSLFRVNTFLHYKSTDSVWHHRPARIPSCLWNIFKYILLVPAINVTVKTIF